MLSPISGVLVHTIIWMQQLETLSVRSRNGSTYNGDIYLRVWSRLLKRPTASEKRRCASLELHWLSPSLCHSKRTELHHWK